MLSILSPSPRPACLEEHYGLAQRPFSLTLDQGFVYASRSYAAALRDVRLALERREGLVVITGDTGTGKTMLCRTLLQELAGTACVSVVLDPRVTVEDLLLHVLTDFGVIIGRHDAGHAAAGVPTRHQLMRALQQCLASLIPVGGYGVLIIDEAQHLDPSVLEQLRLLLNLETNDAKLLQIVLIGHPDLTRLLQRPALRPLDQRVARRCELTPLDAAEVKRYIEHRVSIAQRPGLFTGMEGCQPADLETGIAPSNRDASVSVFFTPSAIRAVAARARGIPRIVNLLCNLALEMGYERGTHSIDARLVRAAAKRTAVRASPRSGMRAVKTAIGAAAVIVVTAGAGAWQAVGHRDAPVLPAPPAAFAAAMPSSDIWARAAANPAQTRPLDEVDSVNVRVAAFRAGSRATALAAQLTAAGLPAFTRPQGSEWQVVVGPYVSEAQTVAVREHLAAYGHPDTGVFVEHAAAPTVEP